MSPAVYATFQEICAQESIQGPALEVGAVIGPDSLLRLPCLQAVAERVGINIEKTVSDDGCRMVQGNANEMSMFADGSFETVLCNSTLEHDPFFWKTIAEIHRVTASGGVVVIGVPGFAGMGVDCFARRKSILGLLLRLAAKMTKANLLLASTPTLGEHFFPSDYYRFTEQAMREVFLADFHPISVRRIMNPPRIIGWGRKP
jgi:SAM-dependent methyltransferase